MNHVRRNEQTDGCETLRALGSLATLGDELSEALSFYWSSADVPHAPNTSPSSQTCFPRCFCIHTFRPG